MVRWRTDKTRNKWSETLSRGDIYWLIQVSKVVSEVANKMHRGTRGLEHSKSRGAWARRSLSFACQSRMLECLQHRGGFDDGEARSWPARGWRRVVTCKAVAVAIGIQPSVLFPSSASARLILHSEALSSQSKVVFSCQKPLLDRQSSSGVPQMAPFPMEPLVSVEVEWKTDFWLSQIS